MSTNHDYYRFHCRPPTEESMHQAPGDVLGSPILRRPHCEQYKEDHTTACFSIHHEQVSISCLRIIDLTLRDFEGGSILL
jgi:hypothetical protein